MATNTTINATHFLHILSVQNQFRLAKVYLKKKFITVHTFCLYFHQSVSASYNNIHGYIIILKWIYYARKIMWNYISYESISHITIFYTKVFFNFKTKVIYYIFLRFVVVVLKNRHTIWTVYNHSRLQPQYRRITVSIVRKNKNEF